MRLLSIRLKHYKGVSDVEVEFRPTGITIIQGPNEVGKTSLVTALEMLLEYADSSAHRDVMAAKPKGQDRGTEIEARMEIGGETLTYFKRYHRDKETQLTIESNTGKRTLVGREAHDYVRDCLVHQTDWELWKALKIVQGTSTDDVAHISLGTSPSLREALDRAAGGGIGSIDDTLFDRVKRERDRYYTATGAELKAAFGVLREDVRQSREDLERIDQQMADVDQDTERLEYVDRELHATVEELAYAQEKLQRTQEVLKTIHEVEHQHRIDLEQLSRLQEHLATLQAQRSQREHLTRDEAGFVATLHNLTERLNLIVGEQTTLELLLKDVKSQYDVAEARRREARRTFDGLSEDLDGLSAREELAGLDTRVTRIHHLQSRVAETTQRRQRIRIDQGGLDKIRLAADAVKLAQSALQVGSPTAVIRAIQPMTLLFNGQAVDLLKEEERKLSVSEPLNLVAPSLFDLAVYPGASVSELQAKLDQEQRALHILLADYGVQDPTDAENQWVDYRTLSTQIQDAQKQLDAEVAARGLGDLERRMAELTARLNDYESHRPDGYAYPESLDDARNVLENARLTVEQCDESYHESRRQWEDLNQQIQRLQDERQKWVMESTQLNASLLNVRAGLLAERRQMSDEQLQRENQMASEEVATLRQAVEGLGQQLENLEPERNRILAQQLGDQVENISVRRNELRQERAECQGRLVAIGGIGLYEEREEAASRHDHLQADMAALNRRAQAAKLLYDTLNACRDKEQRRYREPLRQRIKELGQVVFGKGFDVTLDETLSVVSRSHAGQILAVDALSTGAKEQMALLVRLAAASLIDPNEGVPIILDDTLGHTDEERMDLMAAVLNAVARNAQIIVLTSATRRYSKIASARVVDLWKTGRIVEASGS